MMIAESMETTREALARTVAAALSQQARHSAHPEDQRVLRRASAEIARALLAEFIVMSRHSQSAELTEWHSFSAHQHE